MSSTTRKAVKAALKPLVRTQEQLQSLRNYTVKVQRLTQAAYYFIKFVFDEEAELSNSWILSAPLEQAFFSECLLSLNKASGIPSLGRSTRTREYRELISRYLPTFRSIYAPANAIQPLKYAQQTCHYQARAMITAYLNNIQYHLAENIRRAVNELFTRRESERRSRSAKGARSVRLKCSQIKNRLLNDGSLDQDLYTEEELIMISRLFSIMSSCKSMTAQSLPFNRSQRNLTISSLSPFS
jgi:hypothetical protein